MRERERERESKTKRSKKRKLRAQEKFDQARESLHEASWCSAVLRIESVASNQDVSNRPDSRTGLENLSRPRGKQPLRSRLGGEFHRTIASRRRPFTTADPLSRRAWLL